MKSSRTVTGAKLLVSRWKPTTATRGVDTGNIYFGPVGGGRPQGLTPRGGRAGHRPALGGSQALRSVKNSGIWAWKSVQPLRSADTL